MVSTYVYPITKSDAKRGFASSYMKERFFVPVKEMITLNYPSFLLVFIPVFGGLKLNQYLFFHFDTSPAVVALPVGIAIAAAYIGRYRTLLPITCAWLLATLTSPATLSGLMIVTVSIAYPLQAMLGGYFLVRLKFQGGMARTRCALLLMGTAIVVPAIAPGITTGVQWLTDSLTVPLWTAWSRAWAGGVLSIVVFTPLITTWYRHHTKKTPQELIETIASLSLLMVITYATFWTKIPQVNTFVVLYMLFMVLFWIGLRLHPRVLALAIFMMSTFGMAGSIIANPGNTPLNQQLLADELFIILIAPIFSVLAALVQERRHALEESKRHVDDLEIALSKIHQEDSAKREFLAVLAHELRNPLATILSSIELINLTGMQAEKTPKILETITNRARTMTRLLDDLLDVTRITQKKFELKRETVDLNRFVDSLGSVIEPLMEKYHHSFVIKKSNGALRVDADPARLEQILTNLLTNSAKYTRPSGLITLTTLREGNNATIYIRDNGVGIPKNMLDRIFEPFFQINRTRLENSNQGIGVGLHLTRNLVEMHGGTIEATSSGVDMGSEFIVRLPLSTKAPISSRPQTHTARPLSRSQKILVVDDNKSASTTLAQMLELNGHTVEVAHNGSEAIQKTLRFKPHSVILDIGLPDMSGYQVAGHLQSHGRRYFLIALTGYGQPEDKELARQAGFHHHLTKPAGIKDIEAVLQKIPKEILA